MSTVKVVVRAMALAMAGMVVVFFAVGALLTDRWHVETVRTIRGEAGAGAVRALLCDFSTWPVWSSMNANLGPQTQHRVEGDAAAVGHRIVWTGAAGRAALRLTEVADGAIGYEFTVQRPDDAEATPRGRGRITWRANGTGDGGGVEVRWRDESDLRTYAERWFGWFGAIQESVRQIQQTSLAGLQEAVEARAKGETGRAAGR
jgi:hypothetical protein